MIRSESFWALVDARARATPNALFGLDESGRQLTFSEYRTAVLRVAAGFHELGIGAGSAVSWILPTGFDALILTGALSRLQAIQNPIVPIYRRREVSHCLDQTGAELLVVPTKFRGFGYGAMARELAEQSAGLSMLDCGQGLPEADPGVLPALGEPRFTDAVRWIFYTSGTTSDPKGARHTDRTILLASLGLAKAMDLRPDDRVGLVFPVAHLGGVNSLVAGLASGCGHLLVEQFVPETSIPFLRDHGVTHAGAGPVFHRSYLEAQRRDARSCLFPRIRAFQGGGAQKAPQLHGQLKQEIGGWGVLSAYGMTECPIISVGRWDDPDLKLACTEGRVNLPETEIHVRGPDGTRLGTGEEGEIWLRAPQMFLGYVDTSLDAAAFDSEGFFCTGDLGRMDADGHLLITGRVKDVIIRKGENISALEVENLLLEHPKVEDVAVIGLPDPERGERCCAVVVGAEPSRHLDFSEMVQFLRDAGVMVQKIPEQWEVVEELPRNLSGKVLKQELRRRFLSEPTS